MIAVDTSALLAIILGEPLGQACMDALVSGDQLLISAGTIAEALIVAERSNVGAEMRRLLGGLGFDVVAVTAASARRVAAAYGRWGKGDGARAWIPLASILAIALLMSWRMSVDAPCFLCRSLDVI